MKEKGGEEYTLQIEIKCLTVVEMTKVRAFDNNQKVGVGLGRFILRMWEAAEVEVRCSIFKTLYVQPRGTCEVLCSWSKYLSIDQ